MHWRSKLIHPGARAPADFRSLAIPVYRGSTVLFDRQADVTDDWRQTEVGYTYGLYGTPTVLELAARIAEIEGARHTFIVPGGQAAIALIYLAFCKAGSHALVPATAYGPNREMGAGLLERLGISVEAYDPLIGARISQLIRDETALIWLESPGSVTMEIQDVPEIVEAAHARGVGGGPDRADRVVAVGGDPGVHQGQGRVLQQPETGAEAGRPGHDQHRRAGGDQQGHARGGQQHPGA